MSVFNFDRAWQNWANATRHTGAPAADMYQVDGKNYVADPYWNVIQSPNGLRERIRTRLVVSDDSRVPLLRVCVQQATSLLARMLLYYAKQREGNLQMPEWTFASAMYNVLYVRSAGLLAEAATRETGLATLERLLIDIQTQKTESDLIAFLSEYTKDNRTDASISCQFTGVELLWTPAFTSPALTHPRLGPLVPKALHSDGFTVIADCTAFEPNSQHTLKTLGAQLDLKLHTASNAGAY